MHQHWQITKYWNKCDKINNQQWLWWSLLFLNHFITSHNYQLSSCIIYTFNSPFTTFYLLHMFLLYLSLLIPSPFFLSFYFCLICYLSFLFPVMFPFFLPSILSLFKACVDSVMCNCFVFEKYTFLSLLSNHLSLFTLGKLPYRFKMQAGSQTHIYISF